jgi:hypothetical protein
MTARKSRVFTSICPTCLDLLIDLCPRLVFSMTRALMSRILKKLGHSVTEAEDGAPALQLILDRPSDEQYDIVFLDKYVLLMCYLNVSKLMLLDYTLA